MCRLVRSLPESLRDSATAAAREAMIDLGLDAIAAVQPPLGYGRTDWRATTCWPKHGTVLGRDKSWGSPCSPAKRRLRVAPVPPQAADLTWPARGARTMPVGTKQRTLRSNQGTTTTGFALAATTARRIPSVAQR